MKCSKLSKSFIQGIPVESNSSALKSSVAQSKPNFSPSESSQTLRASSLKGGSESASSSAPILFSVGRDAWMAPSSVRASASSADEPSPSLPHQTSASVLHPSFARVSLRKAPASTPQSSSVKSESSHGRKVDTFVKKSSQPRAVMRAHEPFLSSVLFVRGWDLSYIAACN